MSNIDQMPAEQALWAYSSMLYDSQRAREALAQELDKVVATLRRELNIVIQQYTEVLDERNDWRRIAKCFAHFKICQSEKCAIYNLANREYDMFMQEVYENLQSCDDAKK